MHCDLHTLNQNRVSGIYILMPHFFNFKVALVKKKFSVWMLDLKK